MYLKTAQHGFLEFGVVKLDVFDNAMLECSINKLNKKQIKQACLLRRLLVQLSLALAAAVGLDGRLLKQFSLCLYFFEARPTSQSSTNVKIQPSLSRSVLFLVYSIFLK